MMLRTLARPLALVLLVLSGCGGETDTQAPASMAGPAKSVARSHAQLGTPITNDQALAAQRLAPGLFREQKESARVVGDGVPFAIDTRDREQVRLYFHQVYSEPTPAMGWTGDRVTGVPGTTTPAFKAATIQRLNWFRAMAGLPAAVRLSEASSAKAQHAALMMSVAGQLSHYPTPDWKFYTPQGAEAAASSNLALGGAGPDAIDQYIRDAGANNAAVGHRRWIFQPNSRTIGTGDVPSATIDGKYAWATNALWVSDIDYTAVRPVVRDGFVAWPNSGYVPYSTVYERWSLSYPRADFSRAKVTITRNGVPVVPVIEPLDTNFGENTIVWKMPDNDETGTHARPDADVRYRVSVSDVIVDRRARSFDYDVTVFDPSIPTPGRLLPVASAPALVPPAQPYAVRIGALPGATAYTLSAYLRSPLAGRQAAPFDAATWTTANNGGHAILDGGALRFYVDDGAWGVQTATLEKPFYVPAGAGQILVTRSMRAATATQKFMVQISDDEGVSWRDAYSETGRASGTPVTGVVRVDLGAYAGKFLRLRLGSDVKHSAYIGPSSGWTVTDIAFEGVDELTQGRQQRNASGEFSLSPARPGNYLLLPRVELYGMIDSDPGTPALVTVDGAVLTGPRSSYAISRSNGVLTIVDNTGRDGTQTVRDPFRIDFTDITLAFDADGNAGKAYRLYRAAFNRKPDSGGLGFWIRGLDGGLTPENMARAFAGSPEFASLYGTAPTHDQVITALYRNVLHRAPDQGGAAFWLQNLANGMPLEQVLVEFSESPENKQQVAAEIDLGIAYTRQ